MSDPSGVGGAGNEQGSRLRAGVAAYLAVHGLVDRPVLGVPGAVPVAISLEADEAVDDIVSTMADDSRWYLQSKRIAGGNEAFRAAVRQWARQSLGPRDRVVLVARRLRGLLDGLQPRIEQVVRGDPIAAGPRADVDAFVAELTGQGVANPNDLLRHVQLLQWQVEDAADPDQAAAVALLAGSIVPEAQAGAAFEVLRARMQLAASRRHTTTARDWIDALVGAGIEVYADGAGPRGARERARQIAIADYRAALAARANHLDLSTLVANVPEIVVADALGGWRVGWDARAIGEVTDTDVLNVVRATPRFVIAGLPGMGKSELMRQLASRLASDPMAPLPVHVDLRDITAAIRTSSDLTLDLLLDRPSRSVTGQDPATLKSALTAAVLSGEAILQIDGLDEAQRARGQVTAGLSRLLDELPAEVGLVLTTRHSALPAAEHLHVPVVQLDSPSNLRRTMLSLLAALADTSVDAASDRDGWLAARSAEVNAAYDNHDEVWKVPLLATLATVRLASGRTAAGSAAILLNQVIEDNVREWELRRSGGIHDLDDAVRPEMLLGGFAAIGHHLVGVASITPDEALEAVRQALEVWELPAPLVNTIAVDIVGFWDDRVGVFVDNGEGVVPRSRQFAELAEVRWLTQQDEDTRRQWLIDAITDDAYGNSVSLATAIDPVIRDALIDSARRDGTTGPARERAVTWVSRYWASWPVDRPGQVRDVIDALAGAGEDRLHAAIEPGGFIRRIEQGQQQRDGGGWQFVLALIDAPHRADVEEYRRQRIEDLALSPSRRTIVSALMGLRDARDASRPIDRGTIAAIEEILTGPSPARSQSTVDADGVHHVESTERYVTGVGDVAERAVDYLDQLSEGAPAALHRMRPRLSMTQWERIGTRLEELGHPDPEPYNFLAALPSGWSESREDHHGMGWMLRVLADLPTTAADYPATWRYPELGQLMAALRYGRESVGEFVRATEEDPEILRPWFLAHIEATRLDVSTIVRQAQQLLGAADAEAATYSLSFGRLAPKPESVAIAEETALALVPTFASASGWIVNRSFRLLSATRFPAVAATLAELGGATSWRGRFERNVVGIVNSADPAAVTAELAESQSTAVRAAAGAMLAADFVTMPQLLARLQADSDGQVRFYSDGDVTTAESWTCAHCLHANPPDQSACTECHIVAPWG